MPTMAQLGVWMLVIGMILGYMLFQVNAFAWWRQGNRK
jgi:hypothetical protein